MIQTEPSPSTRSPSGGRARIAAGRAFLALGLAALVLGAAWSWPRPRAGSGRPLVAVLVDASESARTFDAEGAAWLAGELATAARSAAAGGAELAVVAYATGAQVLQAPGPPDERSARALAAELARAGPDRGASTLAAALDLVEALRHERGAHAGTLLVLGDASFTGPDPAARIERLARAGFAIERRTPPRDPLDVAVGGLRVPRTLNAGQALVVRVPVHARAAAVELRGTVRTGAGVVERRAEVAAPPGAPADPDGYRAWLATLDFGPLGPGWADVEVTVAPRGGARTLEPGRAADDVSSARVRVGGAPIVVLAGAPGRERELLAAALRGTPALAVEDCAGAEIPAALASADVLVTLDVAPHALPGEEIAAFVRNGGGWLALAGERTRAEFPAGLPVLGLLPLVPPDDAPPPRDVLFLVDGSGSMSGATQAALRAALADVLAWLGPGEALEFRWFAAELSPPTRYRNEGDPVARAAFARSLLDEHPPGGPTRLLRAVQQVLDERAALRRDALLFLFSDGRESGSGDNVALARTLAEHARELRVRVVPVAIGSDVDAALLSAVLTPGVTLFRAGELADAPSAERLAELLRREFGAPRAAGPGEHAVHPVPAEPADELARAVIASELRALALPWPAVATYLRAGVARGAEALWRSEREDPLLALHRVGLGRTAACAFAPGPDAPAWGAAEPLAVFAPLVQALASGSDRGALALTLDAGRLVLTARDPAALPAEVRARVTVLESGAGVRDLVLGPDFEPGAGPVARSAPWPDELDREGLRAAVELALEPPRTFLVHLPRDPESRWPRRSWAVPAPAGVGAGDLLEAGSPGGDRRAARALAAAVFLLFLGCVLGPRLGPGDGGRS